MSFILQRPPVLTLILPLSPLPLCYMGTDVASQTTSLCDIRLNLCTSIPSRSSRFKMFCIHHNLHDICVSLYALCHNLHTLCCNRHILFRNLHTLCRNHHTLCRNFHTLCCNECHSQGHSPIMFKVQCGIHSLPQVPSGGVGFP